MNIGRIKEAISGLHDDAFLYVLTENGPKVADFINVSINTRTGCTDVLVGVGNCPWDDVLDKY